MNRTIRVKICGVTPLLVNRFREDAEQAKATRKQMVKDRNPREEATKAAYIADDGSFYFSAFAITGCMTEAGSNHKQRGSRKSLRFVVPAAVRMTTDTVTILNGDGTTAVKDFEVDSRPVTIPATKGKVMRYRPRFDCWSAEFLLGVEDDLLAVESAQQLLSEGGQQGGIGDFRPQKRGPFGTFRITLFEDITKLNEVAAAA
jgi:hypothetical protein